MGRLDGKTCLITGAARGQGAAEATLFTSEGAHVWMVDVLDEEGQRLAESNERQHAGRFHWHEDLCASVTDKVLSPKKALGEANGTPLSVRMASGSPNSQKTRSKAEKAN